MPKQITSVRWEASNVPYGMAFNETDGIFSGTPDVAGNYTVPVTVETNYGRDTKDVFVKVKSLYWEQHEVPHTNLGEMNTTSKFVTSTLNMYYGDVPKSNSKCLLMPFYSVPNYSIRGYVYSSSFYDRLYGTYDFTFLTSSTSITDRYIYNYYCYEPSTKRLYFRFFYNYSWLTYLDSSKKDYTFYNITSFIEANYVPFAFSYSPSLNKMLVVAKHASKSNMRVFLVQNGVVIKNSGGTYYQDVNFAVSKPITNVVWSPKAQVFCVSGENGVAVSPDGETWTVKTSGVPTQLCFLDYREDKEDFFGVSLNDKKVYSSVDGLTWSVLSSLPTPIKGFNTLAAFRYTPEKELYSYYITGNMAYFSRDLTNWVESQVTNVNPNGVGDLIYYPPEDCWVLTVGGGRGQDYYYTKPASEIIV